MPPLFPRLREGDDEVEALSVEIVVKNMKVRCCVAYGCQENDLVDRKDAFWTYLDEEVALADPNESGFVLQFDGILWAFSQMAKCFKSFWNSTLT